MRRAYGRGSHRKRSPHRRFRHFELAVSGGNTPWVMMRALASEDVPWQSNQERNPTHVQATLLDEHIARRKQLGAGGLFEIQPKRL